MRIGIYFNQDTMSGGGYYESLNRMTSFSQFNVSIVIFTSNKNMVRELEGLEYEAYYISVSYLDRIFLFFRRQLLLLASNLIPGNTHPVRILKKLFPKYNRFEKNFIKNDIDVIYFTSPETNSVYIEHLNFLFAVWDLAHNTIPYFPEIRHNYAHTTRERLYRHTLPLAWAITVGNEYTRKLLVTQYGQSRDKIFLLPFKPSGKLTQIESSYFKSHGDRATATASLYGDYLYYPAQYSPHKNHRIIIDFIAFVSSQNNQTLKAVFTGTDRGNKKFLEDYVRSIGLQEKIKFLDFQTDVEVFELYKGARAVIMPSYIGPGTLPTMEAMHLNIPLIVLDNYENREFYQHAAEYIHRENFIDVMNFINNLDDAHFKIEVINRVRNRYAEIFEVDETERLQQELLKFLELVKTWKR